MALTGLELTVPLNAAKILGKAAASKWFQRMLALLIVRIKIAPLSWRLGRGEWLVRCTNDVETLATSAGLVIQLLSEPIRRGRASTAEETDVGGKVIAALLEMYNLVTLARTTSSETTRQIILNMPHAFSPYALDACMNLCSHPDQSRHISPRFLELYADLLLLDLAHTAAPTTKRASHLHNAATWLFDSPDIKLLSRALPLHPWLATCDSVGSRICSAYAALLLEERLKIMCSIVDVGALSAARALETVTPMQWEGRVTRLLGEIPQATRDMLQSAVTRLCDRLKDDPSGLTAPLLEHLLGVACEFQPSNPQLDSAGEAALMKTDAGNRVLVQIRQLQPSV
eukprot:gene9305-16439_t